MIIYFNSSDEMYKEFTVKIMTNARRDHNPKIDFAVIFGVVNKMGPQGTDLDIKNIKTTFDDLNFATWVIKNATSTIMKKAVKIASEYNFFDIELKWLVFYYAGHGGSIDKKDISFYLVTMTNMRIFQLIQKSLINFNLTIRIVILVIINVCFSLTVV